MTYLLNSVELDPDGEEFQKALERVWSTKQRLHCGCTKAAARMYVARVAGQFIIKRMPGTGHLHTATCGSYMPPAGISGLSQVLDSAIEQSELDDLTYLRLDFPLSQSGKRMALPPPTGDGATEALAPPRKLSLTGLLHYLWHEADLVKWTPRMEGKRWWGVIQRSLMNASDGMMAKNSALVERMYIPEPFKAEHKTELAGQRAASFAKLKPSTGATTQLGLLIAEYKSHESARFGSKFTFKHIPDCGFFADQDLVTRFERIFKDMFDVVSLVDGAHLIVIATFSISKTGYPVLNQIAAMPVTRNWIPFDHMNDVTLLDHLTQEHRQFVKSLRFNLPKNQQIASVILTDCEQPTACFIGDQILDETMQDDFPTWIWSGDTAIPVLPLTNHP